MWFDDKLGEKALFTDFVCEVHRVSNKGKTCGKQRLKSTSGLEVMMIGEIDITVEIVEIDPDNQYIFIEGPGKNGRKRIKMHGLDPDEMTVGDGMYIPINLWDKWCLMWDMGAWESISWHA